MNERRFALTFIAWFLIIHSLLSFIRLFISVHSLSIQEFLIQNPMPISEQLTWIASTSAIQLICGIIIYLLLIF